MCRRYPEELVYLDAGGKTVKKMNETITYTPATKRLWRNRFIVPAFIFKAMKVTVDIFLPKPCAIEFVEGAV